MNAENVKNELNNGRWEQKAKETMENAEKMEELRNQKEGLMGNAALAKVKDSLCLLFRYLDAIFSKRYTDYSIWALTKIVAVLIYVVSPLDLVPDIIPWIGFLDDVIAVGYVISLTAEELDKFRAWEYAQMVKKTI